MTAPEVPQKQRDDMLAYEKWMADVLKERSSRKSWLEGAGVIPAATAILTVIVTSLFSCYGQEILRAREIRFADKKDREQAAHEAINHANSAIAGMLKITEERLKIANGDYSKDTALVRQGSAVAQNDNEIQQAWRKTREDVEMELYLAFDSVSGVPRAWKKVRSATEAQTECIEDLVDRSQNGRLDLKQRVHDCDPAVQAGDRAIADLRSKLQSGYERIRRLE
jgi:hypothetical protein